MLRRLFGAPIDAADPDIRRQAVDQLEHDDPKLFQIAREDPEATVRMSAVARLNDLVQLADISSADRVADVRGAAAARLRTRIAGADESPAPVDERARFLRERGEPDLLVHVARHADAPDLRLLATETLTDEAVLAEIASRDATSEVRAAAFERVQEPKHIETIVRAARGHDKRLHRLARERLAQIELDREVQEQAASLCVEIEQLAAGSLEDTDGAAFQRVDTQWEALSAAPPPELAGRYIRARDKIRASMAAQRDERVRLQAACDALEQTLDRLKAMRELSLEECAQIEKALAGRLPVERTGADPDLVARHEKLHAELERRYHGLETNHLRAERLRHVIEAAQELSKKEELDRKAVDEMRARWKALEQPEDPEMCSALDGEFTQLCEQLQDRLARQSAAEREKQDEELAGIRDALERIEKDLQAGQLGHAIPMYDDARTRLQELVLPDKPRRKLEAQIHRLAPRIKELRSWRHWGTDRSREELCAEVEQLLGRDDPPPERARSVRKFRDAWKKLDQTDGGASKALWERFNKACTEAYAPCKEYFDKQASERAEHLARKEALLDTVEEYAQKIDWEQPDWHDIDRYFHHALREWRHLGPVDRRKKKTLAERRSRVFDLLDDRIRPKREAELARRQELILRMEELAKSDDARGALDELRAAQRSWRPQVTASPRQEHELWKTFRAACDAVYARARESREAADESRKANLERKTELCGELEALAEELNAESPGAEQGTTLAELKTRFQTLRSNWSEIGHVPRASDDALRKRYQAACRSFDDGVRHLRAAQAARSAATARECAQICLGLERAALRGESASDTLAATRARWEELSEGETDTPRELKTRFERACAALEHEGAERAALTKSAKAHTERRRELCMRLEIVLGVDSPPELEGERMRYRIAWLENSMRGKDSSPGAGKEEARRIEEEWLSLGPAVPEEAEALEARFSSAIAAAEGK